MKCLTEFVRYVACVALLSSIFNASTLASATPPRFEEYPVTASVPTSLKAPKLITSSQLRYAINITDGVWKGFGVIRDGIEQPGPNFAGNMIVIQWPCGAPCLRMAAVNAETGEVFYPPISIGGLRKKSFDLPLLTAPSSYPRNPELVFRVDSNLMIIKATLIRGEQQVSDTYYFLWNNDRWRLLQKRHIGVHGLQQHEQLQ